MAYMSNPRLSFGNYVAAGQESETPKVDLREILAKHSTALEDLQKQAGRNERLRKIATAATVAGALFAAIRLTDIWLAVRHRRQRAV